MKLKIGKYERNRYAVKLPGFDLRIHWTLSAILKNKQKSMKWCFLICKSMYILKAYSVHYTLRQNINFTNTPSDKMVQKMHPFSFDELQLIKVLILICNFYMSWSTRFVSVKLCVGFSIFDSVSFLLVCIFVQQNAWTPWL